MVENHLDKEGFMKVIVNFAVLMLLLSGCADRVQVPADLASGEAVERADKSSFVAGGDASGVANSWLSSFDDPELDRLVEEALVYNPDLQTMVYRAQQSEAQTRVARAALKPTVGYNAQAAQTFSSADYLDGRDRQGGGLGIGWEADLWGRIAAGSQAAVASQRAVEADYAYAKQSLVANVAKSWFQYNEARLQRKLAGEIVNAYEEVLRYVDVQFSVGKVSDKDLNQARVEVDRAHDSLIQAENAYVIASRSLEVLLGRYPGAEFDLVEDLAQLPPFPATGAPLQLLERRPDLIAAEEQIRAAFFLEQEARLALLPSLSFSFAPRTSNLANFIGQLTAGISGPLYTGGALEAEIDSASAEQKIRLTQYQSAVLAALNEVETYISNEKFLKRRTSVLGQAVEHSVVAVEETRSQYEVGQVDLSVLLLQQAKLDASKSTLLNVESQTLQNRVNLYLALGGGFDNSDSMDIKKDVQASGEKI